MTRHYSIHIRNEAETYVGRNVQDRYYAKMSSGLAPEGIDGKISLQIAHGTNITLTPEEADQIAKTLSSAAQGARYEGPPTLAKLSVKRAGYTFNGDKPTHIVVDLVAGFSNGGVRDFQEAFDVHVDMGVAVEMAKEAVRKKIEGAA